MEYYVVKYTGPFGFIKPWTAVRDGETFSQQFLTQSIVEGIEKKLFPEMLDQKGIQQIFRHRLNYCGIDIQQERTWSKGGFKAKWEKNQYKTNIAVLKRGVMLEPNLYLAFKDKLYAHRSFVQSICLCRNEDIVLPKSITRMTEHEFNLIPGFELLYGNTEQAFKVGFNRFDNASDMMGELKVVGNPIRNSIE